MKHYAPVMVVGMLALAGAAQADLATWAPPTDASTVTPSDIPAVRVTEPPVVDGDLSDAAWATAPTITGFQRVEPVEEGPGFGSAVFKVLYDDEALYIGARIYQPPGILRSNINPRDDLGFDDSIYIHLKPVLTSDVAYFFRVNAEGIQRDAMVVGENLLPTWDAVWQSEGQEHPDGYSIEIRLPFRNLRFASGESQSWGIGFGVRTDFVGQLDFWPAFSSERGSRFNQLGVLKGLNVHRGPNIELTPSLVIRHGGGALPNQPFEFDRVPAVRFRRPGVIDPGLDVQVGVTSGLTANLTLNPDFSQVEADPAQLNYNLRYPLLLDEKRPFFLEGLDYFDTPIPMLYTRGINDPLVGLKFSGAEGQLSMGLSSVVDLDPPPSRITWDPSRVNAPTTGFENLDGQQTSTTALRLNYHVSNLTSLGVFVADKQALGKDLTRLAHNDLVSTDMRTTVFDSVNIALMAGASRTSRTLQPHPAEPPEGGAGQEGPGIPRFARPLTGGFGMASLSRTGRNLSFSASTEYYGTAFYAETSSLARTGYVPSRAAVSYKFEINKPWLTWLEPGAAGSLFLDERTLDRTDWSVGPTLTLLTLGESTVTLGYNHGEESFNGQVFRAHNGYAQVESNPSTWLGAVLQLTAGDRINYDPSNAFLGSAVDTTVALTVRPTSLLRADLSYTNSRFYRPDGEGLEANVNLARASIVYSFSPRSSVRVISQLDTSLESLATSVLFAYVPSPGTVVYLGAQDSEPISRDSTQGIDRRGFVKVALRWF